MCNFFEGIRNIFSLHSLLLEDNLKINLSTDYVLTSLLSKIISNFKLFTMITQP